MRSLLADLSPNTKYVVQVRTVSSSAVSEWSRKFEFTTIIDSLAPERPSNLAIGMTGATANLTWAPVTTNEDGSPCVDLVGYEITIRSQSVPAKQFVTRVGNVANYDFTYDQNRRTFGTPKFDLYYEIVAFDTVENMSAMAVSGTLSIEPLDPPSNLTAISVSDGIALDWTGVDHSALSGYRVYQGTTPSAQVTKVYESSATSYVFPSTMYGQDQYFKVTAFDMFGRESDPSNVAGPVRPKSPFTVDTVGPATPTGLSVTLTNSPDGKSASATASWTAVPDPDNDLDVYVVGYKRSTDSAWQFATVNRDSTSVKIEPIVPFVNYDFRIMAKDFTSNPSSWSPIVTKTAVANTAPATTTGVAAVAGRDSITVSWTAGTEPDVVNGLGTYLVDIATNTSFTAGLLSYKTGATNITVSGLQQDQTYYARVKTVDSAGMASASWSATVSAKTGVFPTTPLSDGNPPASSPTPTATGGAGYVWLSWPASTNVDPVTYEVHVGTASNFTTSSSTKIAEATGTTIVVENDPTGSPLVDGTNYYFKTVAKDRDGSAPSSAASAAAQVIKTVTESFVTGYVDPKVATLVKNSVVEYAVNSSEVTAPTSGWSTSTPTRTPGSFVWYRTSVTYGNNTASTSSPALLTGNTGAQGTSGTPAAYISLTATTQVLTSPAAGGTTTPSTSTVTGTATNTTITAWTYSVDNAAFSPTVPAGVSRTNNVVTITGSAMTAKTITVKMADANGVSDTLTVAKVFDGAAGANGSTGPAGADAYTVVLSNEAHTFAGSTSAAIAGSTTSTVIAYKGASQVPATVGTITGHVTGLTTSIASNGTNAPVITVSVTTALTTKNGTLTIPVTVDGKTFTKTIAWSLALTGATGSQGIQGPAGPNGQTFYTWIKYADTPTSGMADTPTGKTYMGIAYNKTSATESSNYSDYDWSLIKGADGADGKGISSTAVTYQAHTNGTTAPTGTWQSSPVATSPGQFLWTRTITTYTDSSTSTAYAVSAHGATGSTGSTGATGRGISSTAVTYQVGTSGTTAPTGSWLSTVPATSPGQFLWTRTITTFTSAPLTETSYSVAAHGATGSQGIQGPPGANGQPTYTWIKYATSSAGAGMSDDPTGKTYIGIAYNKLTQTESSTPSDYEWSLIQGPQGPQGPAGADAKSVSLTATTQVLTSPAAGGATNPATSVVTGTAVNTTITAWTYSIDGSTTFSPTLPTGVTRSGNTVTITGSAMTAKTVTVKMADASGNSDTLTVAKVFDGATGPQGPQGPTGSTGTAGADAYTVILSNEAHTFAGSTNAAIAGSTTSTVIAYKGATQVAATVGTITGQVTGLTTSIASNGTTAPVITVTVTTALTTRNGTLTVPVTVDGKTFTKTIAWAVSYQGSTGSTGATGPQGVSVSSVTPYFTKVTKGASAPAAPTTSPPPGPWFATEPTFSLNTELYRVDRILYSNSTFSYTAVTKVSAYDGADAAIAEAQNLANTAKSEAITAASNDATTKANNATTAANNYTDNTKTALQTEIGNLRQQAIDSAANATNLIANPSFEQDLAGWITQGGTTGITTARSRTGTKSLAAGGSANAYSTPLAVTVGETYRLSLHVWAISTTGVAGGLRLQTSVDGTTWVSGSGGGWSEANNAADSADWVKQEREYTVQSGVKFIRLRVGTALTAGTLYVDDASIQNITESKRLEAFANDVESRALSRGTDLVTNGTGYLKSNYNFPSFDVNFTDVPTGAVASFYKTAATAEITITSESIPYDPAKTYALSFMARQTDATVNRRFYAAIIPVDAAGATISSSYYGFITGTTTTLAAPLNPGDTTITLTSSANWWGQPGKNAGTATHRRSIIWWDYVDPNGKAWPQETYSRYHSGPNYWADGGISGNVITLNAPYSGPARPAGTKLSNGTAGANYIYPPGMALVPLPNEWTRFSASGLTGIMNSSHGPYEVGATWASGMPPGSAGLKIGWLWGYSDTTPYPVSPAGRGAVASVSFSDAAAANYAANNITETQITNGAITTPKIATNAIDARTIAANAVTSNAILANSIIAGKIATDAVDSAQIKANAITTVKLDTDAVDARVVKAGAIGTVALAAEAVDATKIKANTINATHMTIGDTSNMATINESVPGQANYGYNHIITNGWSTRDVNAGTYFMFRQQTGPLPFKTGDRIRLSFEAYADAAVTCYADTWLYGNATISQRFGTVALKTTVETFDFEMTVTADTNLKTAFLIGLVGVAGRNVFVRNVRAYRMNAGELIVDGAIRTNHISAGSVTSDRLDSSVITGRELVLGDLTNYSPIRSNESCAVWGTNLSPTNDGGWVYRNTKNHYFGFRNTTAGQNFPVRKGETLYVEFEATSPTSVSTSLNLYTYGGAGNFSIGLATTPLTSTPTKFSATYTPTADLTDRTTWFVGLYGTGMQDVSVMVRNVKIMRLGAGALTIDGNVIATGTVEANALKASTLTSTTITLGTGGVIKSADFDNSNGFSISGSGIIIRKGTISASALEANSAFVNTLNVGAGGSIQSTGYSASTGFQLSASGLTIRGAGNTVDASVLKGGTITGTTINVGASGTLNVDSTAMIKSNNYNGTATTDGSTGWALKSSTNAGVRLVIHDGLIDAKTLKAESAIINEITIGATNTGPGGIRSYDYVQNSGGFKLSTAGLEVNKGSISAAALRINSGVNLLPLVYSDFESVTTDEYNAISGHFYVVREISKTEKRFGTQCLKLQWTGGTGAHHLMSTGSPNYNIEFDPTKPLIASAYLKGSAVQSIAFGFRFETSSGLSDLWSTAFSVGTTWARKSAVVTPPANSTGRAYLQIRVTSESQNQILYVDGVQVEERTGATDDPSPWKPPSFTTIDGGQITTGVIKSNSVNSNNEPYWSINKDGNARFAKALVVDELLVGDPGNTSRKSVVQSINYIRGSRGWQMDSNGRLEANDGVFRGNLGFGIVASNSVSDGSFESETEIAGFSFADPPDVWTQWPDFWAKAVISKTYGFARSGGRCAKMVATTDGGGSLHSSSFHVTAGKQYEVSFAVAKGTSNMPLSAFMYLSATAQEIIDRATSAIVAPDEGSIKYTRFDQYGNAIDTGEPPVPVLENGPNNIPANGVGGVIPQAVDPAMVTPNDYVIYSATYTIPAGKTNAFIRIINRTALDGTGTRGDLYVDDVSCIEIGRGGTELSSAGIRLFGEEGNEVAAFVHNRPSYLNILGKTENGLPQTLAQIDQTGSAYFSNLSVQGSDMVIGGRPLIGKYSDYEPSLATDATGDPSLFDTLARGIVALGNTGVNDEIYGSKTQSYMWAITTSFIAEAGRSYRISFNGSLIRPSQTTYPAGVTVTATWADPTTGLADTPTFSSTGLIDARITPVSTSKDDFIPAAEKVVAISYDGVSGTHGARAGEAKVTLWVVTGAANATLNVRDRMQLVVEDIGIRPDEEKSDINTSINTTAATVADPPPPPAKVKRTKTYTMTSSKSWYGSGGVRGTNTDVVQGYYPGNGNQKGLFFFPSWTGDLSGATVNKVEVYVYATHWYNSSGGTAAIKLHGSSSPPASFPSVTTALNVSSWQKGEGKWVTLPSSTYAGFKSGTYRGFGLGPAPSNSYTYYGRFEGRTSSSVGSKAAKVRITYTK